MARERYLLDAGEDTIHSNIIVPTTKKEKRENWWYYNRVKLIVGALVAATVIYFIYTIVSQVKPDYTVALMTSYVMPSELSSQLEDRLAQYADDRNGDGKVVVSLVNYAFSDQIANSDPNQMQASFVKFSADASSGDSVIFLHNEEAFDFMKNDFQGLFCYNDGTPMPDAATDFENAMISWEELDAFQDFELKFESEVASPEAMKKLFEELRLSVRSSDTSVFQGKEDKMEYYNANLEFLERIKTGQKWVEG